VYRHPAAVVNEQVVFFGHGFNSERNVLMVGDFISRCEADTNQRSVLDGISPGVFRSWEADFDEAVFFGEHVAESECGLRSGDVALAGNHVPSSVCVNPPRARGFEPFFRVLSEPIAV